MTRVYLAFSQAAVPTLKDNADKEPVHLLIAYPFLDLFLKNRAAFNLASWCMDSGAYSAWHSGTTIDIASFHAACKEHKGDLAEAFGLDVIYDARNTRRNLERAWSDGIPAIPTFHQRERWEQLAWCCEHSDKVAISGKWKGRRKWIRSCFTRIPWPKRVHGFAMASMQELSIAPFDSVDAATWIRGPGQFGKWSGFTGKQLRKSIGSRRFYNYWLEVQEYFKRERWAAFTWREHLAEVEALARGPAHLYDESWAAGVKPC